MNTNKSCACGFFPWLGTFMIDPSLEKENCFYHSRKECYEIPEPKIIKETHSIAGELMNGSEEGAKTL